ncbi:hypothetical protein ACWF9B_03475 [Streptomyces sp. NPDC055089]
MSAPDARAQRLARLAAQVDWSKVVDLYTGERYGPEVMEALWAADRVTADRTCTDLRFAAIGDGSSVSGAAAEILPFLVEAARDPDVTARFEILLTIADIAGTGNTAPAAKVDRILEGRWRPTVDARWPAAWERAVEELLPLLDDGDHVIRTGAVRALAQSRAHADALIADFRARFDDEPDLWSAGCLVLGVGELARHATRRRDEALAWLRHLMTVEGKGPEPDIVEDVDAWLAWDEEIRHDVRLQAVEALCRALPGHADPLYAPVTTAALLASSAGTANPPAECFAPRVDVITAADRRLGADLPGRLALAHALLRHDGAEERTGGLRIAACLMSRWRSAVPALLPAVAERVDDARPENRVLALRILAMCGAAARPWADLVAPHLAPAGEPDEPTREHAVWALSRMGDDRCVPPLAEMLALRGDFTHRRTGSAPRGWDRGELDLAEALAPFAAHTDVLLVPLLAHINKSANRWHPYFSLLRKWHREGADVIPRLTELLDEDATLMVSAHALLGLADGAAVIAPAHRERLRARIGPPAAGSTGGLAHLSPFEYRALTGDGEPVRAPVRSPDDSASREPNPQLAEAAATPPPAAEGVARQLRATAGQRIADGNRFDAMAEVRGLWQLTADPRQVVPLLIGLIRICPPPGSTDPTVLAPLRLLAEVAAADPASIAPAAPVLHALLDADERSVRHDDWRSVRDDEALCAAARAVLDAG